MIPGVNPRQLKAMMKQMGMSQDDIEATQVIIKTPNKSYVFEAPQVQKIVMQGQASFQITGDYSEVEDKAQITISEDDVKTVSEQAQVSDDEAMKALQESNGDIAQAIINLTS